MAEAPAITVTPKQMGKHLRSIRRRKGLSLSEVARGAGLSRRELVSYERGKVPIPESDLWVLAGSCGVDVSELVPSAPSNELVVAASTTTIGDTVSQLRRAQDDVGITPYLHTLHKLQALAPGKRVPVKERELDAIATALGSTPRAIDEKLQEVLHVSPDEAQRLRAMILMPPGGRGKQRALAAPAAALPAPAPAFAAPAAFAPAIQTPEEPLQPLPVAPAAFLDAPLDAPLDPVNGHNVDVFEELARLPEPVPLPDPSAPLPDLLAAHDPFATAVPLVGAPLAGLPDGTVELVDSGVLSTPAALGHHGASSDAHSAVNAVDAPPIDVAARQGSSTWDLGETPLHVPDRSTPDPSDWESAGWQPPAPPAGTDAPSVGFWEGTDDWAPTAPEENLSSDTDASAEPELVDADSVATPLGDDTWAGSAWNANPWTPGEPQTADAGTIPEVNPWAIEEWPRESADQGAWDHNPDPAAVDSGFYVDWGTPETDTPPGWDAVMTPALAEPTAVEAEAYTLDPEPYTTEPYTTEDAPYDTDARFGAYLVDEPATDVTGAVVEPETFTVDPEPEPFVPVDDEPEAAPEREPDPDLISWRAADEVVPVVAPWTPTLLDLPLTTDEPVLADTEVVHEEVFVTAGSDWQLGNALPLVEVHGQGALVMRRADERWALADVVTEPDFAVEVDVDFRSGPGFGVLFRASVDDEGRMSGYSFDIDPIYDGGGYLVRQWHADRELWNPIARVAATDPASMHGHLAVRLVVNGEHLTAIVNGAEVLTVEHLKEASTERGREGASGERVGVQAWSSSDLVIETLRIAAH